MSLLEPELPAFGESVSETPKSRHNEKSTFASLLKRLPRLFPKRLLKGRPPANEHAPKVLAISSPGGHWVQLLRIRHAWDGCNVTYASALDGYAIELAKEYASNGSPVPTYYSITDANRWQRVRLVKQLIDITIVILRHRPDVVVTTGAAAGYFALRIGRIFGARTIWIDSIANADELSLSGQWAGRHADLWLTQWEDLACKGGPIFRGAVM
ncbi:UDP-N-acetylglucosamine--LPS N-acetylglucosamine transferase [Rhodobacteraceae bacterium NNCM2]|nr:UDP-N-acetylglucosamine--LPS N-acetylglucosamine transferase [Coraliihabitans acroporae]